MINGKKIAVIIPCFNLEKKITGTVAGVPSFVDFIVIVDDCSVDKTVEVVSLINDSRIFFIKNLKNLGVGGATVAGFKKAYEVGADIFVKLDGDGQMDSGRMGDLIEPLLLGADYAKGNRFCHPDQLKAMPKARLIGNFILSFFTKLASGCWKTFDPQNGYVATTRHMIEKLPLDKLYKRYFFENDLLVNLNIANALIKDVNMPAIYGDERSSMKLSVIVSSFPWLLANRFFKRIYTKYILYDFSVIGLFYMLGTFLMVFGGLFGAFHWILSIVSRVPATTGTVMISVLPIILGFQLFVQAIVLEISEVKIFDVNK